MDKGKNKDGYDDGYACAAAAGAILFSAAGSDWVPWFSTGGASGAWR